jgi:tetratricopeptide (TPR) repeat protein
MRTEAFAIFLVNEMIHLGLFTAFVTGALLLQAQDPTHTVLAIQDALAAGDFGTASTLIQDSLAKAPKDAGLLNLRGVLHARRDELADARTDFAEAVHFNPRLMPAWLNLARACQQLEQVSCALDAWQRVLQSLPSNGEAHFSLAQIYANRERFAESLRHLEAAKKDDLELRCLDLSGLGRIVEARNVAAHLAQQSEFTETNLQAMRGPVDKPKAATVLAALVEGLDGRGGAGATSLQRLAVAYEQLRRTADARKTLERVAQLDPDNTAHLLELARLAEETKDHEGALGYLAHARDLTPNVARIHFLFGVIAGELNLPIEAKQSLDKALAIEPENPEYNYAMGSVILTTRDAARAASYFRKFVQKRPTDGRGHFALGVAQFGSGDYGSAKQEMRIAQDSKENAPAAEYYLGRIARLEGDLDEATRHLHAALVFQPKFSEPHTELGRIALLKGDTEEAHHELDLAVRLSPKNFQANEQLLVLYNRTHDSRATTQAELLKKLDEDRSKRAELMLRTLEMRP